MAATLRRSLLVTGLFMGLTGTGATFPIEFHNTAGNGVTLMQECTNWGHFPSGEKAQLNLTASAKLWVRPDGCGKELGCLDCSLDCLGCFYISAVLSEDESTLVTGVGYGENNPVKVHNMVGSVLFSAVNSQGQEESAGCSEVNCDVQHIIQAKSSSKFVVDYQPLTSTVSVQV